MSEETNLSTSATAAESESLIMARRKGTDSSKNGRLAGEDEEDTEPIDASAPNTEVNLPEKDSTATNSEESRSSSSDLKKRGYYNQRYDRKRQIKRTRPGSRRRDGLFSREREEKEVEAVPNTVAGEKKPDTAAASASIPSKPSWMPDDLYKKQIESIEVSAAPQSKDLEALKVDERRRGNKTSSKLPARPVSKQEHEEIVRNFYNDQTYRSRKQKRSESKIYKLRSFNNCIKYILINKYATRGGNVLDLGCGKGGDLAKWDLAQISSFVGIDISDQSIKEAIHRYRKSRCQFHAIFATGDAFNVQVPKILSPFKDEVNLQFDTVSMQFCLHYAFVNEETARSALENVSRSLKLGGMFIGTIPSSDFIRWKIKRLPPGEKKWGNSIYSVEFPEVPPRDGKFEKPFGNMYTYYLVDAVDHVPEYLVPFEKLRSLCEEYNMELRYKKNLFELFNKEIPRYFHMLPPPLVDSLKQPDGSYGVSGEDRDAGSFYLAFAFEKTG
ncbi:DEKNAAC103332 [Brettanomyces naardenensis]|uniref:mRNA cap guanine-N(7) methyltransferase n=1 Tax=Brettanomyces naardenensis TaxID=13370 RepID=A0A448YNM6_BRENA|nr:DEKNAAC103332 [Brettanomyces naardenensis]